MTKHTDLLNSSFFKSTIGMDRLFHDLASCNNMSYPPYNLIKSDNRYLISMAVAGFEPEQLTVTLDGSKLIIKGESSEDKKADNLEYIHRGIATRSFTRAFDLAENVEVTDTSYRNGILSIKLQYVVPEDQQPKKLTIRTS